MAKKKIELFFNFASETPGPGDPNVYKDLAPGARLNPAEQRMHALHGPRFTTYEKTFKQVAQLLGEFDFDIYNLPAKNQNVAKALEALRQNIILQGERIDAGALPLKDIFDVGVIKSFDEQDPFSSAVAPIENRLVPGQVNVIPEFEILKINDRTIDLVGGKILGPNFLRGYGTANQTYSVTIDPPEIKKNVEFDISNSVFPKEAINRVDLTYDTGSSRFIGRIPISRARNGLPLRFPVEPAQFSTTSGDLDLQVLWADNGTDRLLGESSSDPNDRDIKILYNGSNSEEAYISVRPSVFLAANPDPLASEQTDTLTIYFYHFYPAWRKDLIVAQSDGEIRVVVGSSESESGAQQVDNAFAIYEVLVSCWDEDSTKLKSSSSWTILSDIMPIVYGGNPDTKGFTGSVLTDLRNAHPIIPIERADWRNSLREKLIPRDSKLAVYRGDKIRTHQLRTDFGAHLPVKVKQGTTNINTGYRIWLDTDFVDVKFSPFTEDSGFDYTKPFQIGGVGFLLCKKNGNTITEVKELTGSTYLEYEILLLDEVILQAKTQHPQAALPDIVSFFKADPITLSSADSITFRAKVTGGNPSDAYFICGENANEIGKSIQLAINSGLGLRHNPRQFELVGPTGSSSEFRPIGDSTLTQDSSKIPSLSAFSVPFLNGSVTDGHTVGEVSFSHDENNTDDSGNKYLLVQLSAAIPGSPDYKLINQQKVSLANHGTLNAATSHSYIIESSSVEIGGVIHFAVLMGFYTGSLLNETTERCAIVVGSVIPRLGVPVVTSKIIGSNTDFSSLYGVTTLLIRSSSFYSVTGSQFHMSADDEGNTIIAFIGKTEDTVSDTVDVFCLDRAKNLRGTYRTEYTAGSNLKVRTACTTAYKGQHSGLVILKKDIASLTSTYTYDFYGSDHHNEEVETALKLLSTHDVSFDTVSNNNDQTDIGAVWSFDNKINVVFSTTNISNDNKIVAYKHLVSGNDIVDLSSKEYTITTFARYPSSQYYYCDGSSIIVGGFDSGVAKLWVAREERVSEVTGKSTSQPFKILARNNILALFYESSNYTSDPNDSFDYLLYLDSAGISEDGDYPSVKNPNGYLFLGYYQNIGEEFRQDEEDNDNLITDPLFVHNKWQYGDPNSLTTISFNRDPVTIAPGEILEYTVTDYQYDYILLDRLEGKVVCVAYDCSNAGDSDLDGYSSVYLRDNSGYYFPVLKQERGLAWFYIDQAVDTNLKIKFTNRGSYNIVFNWATAAVGWKPLMKVDEISWIKKTVGALSVEDATDATTSNYSGGASIRTKGGISAEKQIRSGSNIAASGDINAGGNISAVGSLTVGSDSTIGGDSSVTGNSTVGGALQVQDDVTLVAGQIHLPLTPTDNDHGTRKDYVDYWAQFYGRHVGDIFHRRECVEPTVDKPWFRLTQEDTVISILNWSLLVPEWRNRASDSYGIKDFKATNYIQHRDGVRLYLEDRYIERSVFESYRQDALFHVTKGGVVGGSKHNWNKTITLETGYGPLTAGDYRVIGYGYDAETTEEAQGSMSPDVVLFTRSPYQDGGNSYDIRDGSPKKRRIEHWRSGGGLSNSAYATDTESSYFDGAGDTLVCDPHSDFDLSGDFTIEGYFYPSTSGVNAQSMGIITREKTIDRLDYALAGWTTGINNYFGHEAFGYLWTTNASSSLKKIDLKTGRVVGTYSGGKALYDITDDGTFIWVVDYGSDIIRKINPSTMAQVATVSVGTGPLQIVNAEGFLWVTNNTANSISKVNFNTNTQEVGYPMALGANNPEGIYNDNGTLWISCYGSASVVRFDATSDSIIGSPITVGTNPRGITKAAGFIWVANWGSNSISKINSSGAVVDTLTASYSALSNPAGLVATPDEKVIYICDYSNNSLKHLDTTNSIITAGRISTRANPYTKPFILSNGYEMFIPCVSDTVLNIISLKTIQEATYFVDTQNGGNNYRVASDGTNLWVTSNTVGSKLVKFYPVTGAIDPTAISVGGGNYVVDIFYGGGFIWYIDDSYTLKKVNTSSISVVGTCVLPSACNGGVHDGTFIWVTNYGGNAILKIDPGTMTIVQTITANIDTNPYAIASYGNYIWFSSFGGNNIRSMNKTTLEVGAPIPIGGDCYRMVHDGTYLWAPVYDTDYIYKIDPSKAGTDAVITSTVTPVSNPIHITLRSDGAKVVSYYNGGTGSYIGIIKGNEDFSTHWNAAGLYNMGAGGAYCSASTSDGSHWVVSIGAPLLIKVRKDILQDVAFGLYYDGSRDRIIWAGKNFSNTTQLASPNGSVTNLSTWYHFAVSRKSGKLRMWLNQNMVGEVDDTTDYTGTSEQRLFIGYSGLLRNRIDGLTFYGYMDNIQITKGSVSTWENRHWDEVWSSYTSPKEWSVRRNRYFLIDHANTIDTSAVLFMDGEDPGSGNYVVDLSQYKHFVKNQNSVTFEPRNKYTGSSSYRFTSSAYFEIVDFDGWDLGTGDFTFEFRMWPFFTSGTRYLLLRSSAVSAADTDRIYGIQMDATNMLIKWRGTGAGGVTISTPNNSITRTHEWFHVVVTRESGTLKIYIDGVLQASGADATNYTTGSDRPLFIGHGESGSLTSYSGYLDNIRIDKGIARFTGSSFTETRSGTFRVHPHRIVGSSTTAQHIKMEGFEQAADYGLLAGFRFTDTSQAHFHPHYHTTSIDHGTYSGMIHPFSSAGTGFGGGDLGSSSVNYNTGNVSQTDSDSISSYGSLRLSYKNQPLGQAVHIYEFGGVYNP